MNEPDLKLRPSTPSGHDQRGDADRWRLPGAVALARNLTGRRLQAGDVAIDATVGNGHDTVWLASQVGPGGLVIGCDLQPAAIESGRARLEAAGLLARVRLVTGDHARLGEQVDPAVRRRVRAVMFNLGYLPGSDKSVVTGSGSTLAALAGLAEWLPGGALVTVVAYPGHKGGAEERDAVLAWAARLDPDQWRTQHWQALNRRRPAPELVALERAVQRSD